MDALQMIDEIEQLVEHGQGGWLGKRLINDEAFLTRVQQLRQALSPTQLAQCANHLDQLATLGKTGWLGKRLVNEEEFFTKTQHLRSTLLLR